MSEIPKITIHEVVIQILANKVMGYQKENGVLLSSKDKKITIEKIERS